MSFREFTPARVEAFSDGVIAIIITIMVLELKAPHSAEPGSLLELWPIFLSYLISFVMVAIYWMNHHYMFHSIKTVSDRTLWANTALLFFLSLVPFFTGYVGETHFAAFPVAVYSTLMLACGIAYFLLFSTLAPQLGKDGTGRAAWRKNASSLVIYLLAIPLAYINPFLSLALNFVVAGIYMLPRLWIEAKPAKHQADRDLRA
jgi:uncharacterized membrane protein